MRGWEPVHDATVTMPNPLTSFDFGGCAQAKFALPHRHISQANLPRTSGTVTPLPSLHTKNVMILAQSFTYCTCAGWTTTHLLYSH